VGENASPQELAFFFWYLAARSRARSEHREKRRTLGDGRPKPLLCAQRPIDAAGSQGAPLLSIGYRVVKAALHKLPAAIELAAGIELATPASERWCVNAEDFSKIGRAYRELAEATPDEAERGLAVLKTLVG